MACLRLSLAMASSTSQYTLGPSSRSGCATTTYLYEGNTVRVTDPAGKWKRFTIDALGNLAKVTEPNPAGGEWDTNYSYNALNQLTQVSMPRGASTQTRTFNYNSNGQLTSAVNPENGTTSYSYNADGTLYEVTDAKLQKTRYLYDAYLRVTGTRRFNASGVEQTQEAVNYSFDTNPFAAGFTENAQGRLAAIESKARNNATGATMTFIEMFSYTTAGAVTKKRQRTTTTSTADLDASYSYDNEGVRTSMTYPNAHDAAFNPLTGRTFTYSFDSMKRLTGMTEQATQSAWVSGVQYNAAGQWTQLITPAGTETRQYNTLGQLTRMTIPGVIDFEYTFSATQNNGRITKMKDWISGEEVNYQYDALNRLISAVTTGPEYGLSFTYDGFGNKAAQTVTKGTAPSMSVSVDPATNRLVGVNYDANGNQNGSGGWSYDVANRLMSASGEHYAYVASNKRVWKHKASGVEEVYFYDLSGRRIGTYEMRFQGAQLRMVRVREEFYFAGKLIRSGDDAIALDRLASVRYRRNLNTSAVERHDFYPYGEEKPSASAQERDKFATYHRDATSLDYADQRYYVNSWGRFTTPDPFRASWGVRDPSSLNRYAYVQADPINFIDPSGLVRCGVSWITGADGAISVTVYECADNWYARGGSGHYQTMSDDYERAMAPYVAAHGEICTTHGSCPSTGDVTVYMNVWGGVHTVLDLAGLVPGIGEVADLTNALIYAVRGDPINAAISLAAVIPTGGQAATAAKYAFRENLIKQTGKEVAEVVGKHAHHMFAQKFGDDFAKIGIDIHSPHNGAWWDATRHLENAYQYNKAWEKWFEDNQRLIQSNPAGAAGAAFEFARELAKQYGLNWP